ncbi:UDP-2,3-diacylglucosamine diphosphatase [Pinibacter aurantiacus]|uniref:UDP-2,3-diacylglucosamine diphosphatase n=1 Tax=Pinibacter aurantiacus TaxID=2851599 RepID=A0A9E2S9S3_9BACT|nr:UDP-2,3-diacylglucosamine diphosphatase [Pinibacter aurantiacus]MBV4357382.1 UDP-2,3-diacylglucosamine diphosphatase [Pinibacter aurantiacus]
MEKRSVDVAVLSDLHLGTYGCHAKEILNYLKSISPQILILNGDVIDGWQFSKRYFPAAHMGVIKEIMSLLSKGTRVIYITGNHDEMLRRYSDIQLGNFQLTDKVVIEINNKMTWIFHGDVFDNTTKGSAKILAKLGSSGYGLLILLNKFVNRCLKLMGRERVSFSKKVMEEVNKAVTKINDFEQTAAELAIEKKYDYVICGHIHQPQKRIIETKDGSVMYLNSGDWVENLTSLEYYGNDWHIYEYDHAKFENTKHEHAEPTLNVVTDDIHFYINSLAI